MKKGLIGLTLLSFSMGSIAQIIYVVNTPNIQQNQNPKTPLQTLQRSYDQNFEKIKQEAEMGNVDMQILLSGQYRLQKDYTKANYWLEKATHQGNAEAKSNLADSYAHGLGVNKDPKKALQLYQEAVNMGYLNANEYIGYMYENGIGVEKNEKLALEKFLTIANESPFAKVYVQSLYCRSTSQVYNSENCKIWRERVENNEKNLKSYTASFKWYEDKAKLGSAIHQFSLGSAYLDGKTSKGDKIPQDTSKALFWFNKAAAQGSSLAQNQLGFMYDKGIGVRQDYNQAVYWYQKASNQGDYMAQEQLAHLYSEGLGVQQNLYEAFKLHSQSAKQGNITAQYNLAIAYEQGKGVRQDYSQAFYWYQKSASQGYAYAQNNLGILYLNGLGVRQNNTIAKEWFGKACDNGNQLGCDNYRKLKAQGY